MLTRSFGTYLTDAGQSEAPSTDPKSSESWQLAEKVHDYHGREEEEAHAMRVKRARAEIEDSAWQTVEPGPRNEPPAGRPQAPSKMRVWGEKPWVYNSGEWHGS